MDRSKINRLIEESYVLRSHERDDCEVEVFDKLKFAELIIRECANLAGKAEEAASEGRSAYFVLLEYFGLE